MIYIISLLKTYFKMKGLSYCQYLQITAPIGMCETLHNTSKHFQQNRASEFCVFIVSIIPAHGSKPQCNQRGMLMCEMFCINRYFEQVLFLSEFCPYIVFWGVLWQMQSEHGNQRTKWLIDCQFLQAKLQTKSITILDCGYKYYHVNIVKIVAKKTGWCSVSKGTQKWTFLHQSITSHHLLTLNRFSWSSY